MGPRLVWSLIFASSTPRRVGVECLAREDVSIHRPRQREMAGPLAGVHEKSLPFKKRKALGVHEAFAKVSAHICFP